MDEIRLMEQKLQRKLNMLKMLGEGTSCSAYLVQSAKGNIINHEDEVCLKPGQYAVAKVIDHKWAIKHGKAVVDEYNVWSELRHPRVLRLFDAQNNGTWTKNFGKKLHRKEVCYFLNEYASNGELYELIAQ